jgi:3-oxoacyl-[acyl-carrier-protein] synthase-3
MVEEGQHYVQMEGRPVFKWAIRLLEDTIGEVLTGAQKKHEDIDLWVLHQANLRIIDAAVENMGIDRDKVEIHLDRYGNTSSASVPIALDEAFRAGRIQPGANIMLSGFGAGLSWGTALFRW